MGRPSKYPQQFRDEALELVKQLAASSSGDREESGPVGLHAEELGHGRPQAAGQSRRPDGVE
jgi:hypothetical protein